MYHEISSASEIRPIYLSISLNSSFTLFMPSCFINRFRNFTKYIYIFRGDLSNKSIILHYNFLQIN